MAEKPSDSHHSLVRYQNPVLVVKHSAKKEAKIGPENDRPTTSDTPFETKRETEEILNKILPPRCWEQDGQLWSQSVSTLPATRQDVINLQETLDIQLQQQQARETGICSIRRKLYSECFDELIRQVTINCAERGMLLLRIRDELLMSMQAYETIYCSSIAFGIRKALLTQEEKEKIQKKLKTLEAENNSLSLTINEIKIKIEQNETKNNELRAADEKKFTEEINFLKKTNTQLKTQLEGIISLK